MGDILDAKWNSSSESVEEIETREVSVKLNSRIRRTTVNIMRPGTPIQFEFILSR